MRPGDIVAAKSITHRDVVEKREDKNGREKPIVNQFGFKFQTEHNLRSTVGLFLFLGTFPECEGPDAAQRQVERVLRQLGWKTEGDSVSSAI